MKILITTIGTRGDVQPYVALAVGLKAAGYDMVICTSDRFFALRSAPHEWLLPQVAAVVHHGGAGTTAAALHAGC